MNTCQKAAPARDEILLAWDIHKDADHLLHNRLNAFLVVQALMFGAFFVAVQISGNGGIPAFLYQGVVFVASIVICVGYWWLSQRMIRGILHLKENYLLPHLPVYEGYYRSLDQEKGRSVARLRYPIHQFAPWLFMAVWFVLMGLSTYFHFSEPSP